MVFAFAGDSTTTNAFAIPDLTFTLTDPAGHPRVGLWQIGRQRWSRSARVAPIRSNEEAISLQRCPSALPVRPTCKPLRAPFEPIRGLNPTLCRWNRQPDAAKAPV